MQDHSNGLAPVSHKNNFDFLRLFFSTFVIITHSYAVSGIKEEDILYHFSGGQIILSTFGVYGFFVISGYLITKSMLRSVSLIDYYFKRIARIFPGLIMLLLITIVVGYFINNKTFIQYISHYSTRDYLIFNSLLSTQYMINGLFTNNPIRGTVNSSLWTIPYEFLCYIGLSLLFVFRKNLIIMRIAFIVIFLVALTLQLYYLQYIQNLPPLPFFHLIAPGIIVNLLFFIGGGFWALIPLPNIVTRKVIVFVSIALLILALKTDGMFYYAKYIILPLVLIPFGTMNFKAISWIRQYGDYSYGIYLYGFFIQQILEQYFRFNYLELMLITIPIAYLAGALSWHLVEKKALRFKTPKIIG